MCLNEKRDIRFVKSSLGTVYLRKEDVVAYLYDLAAGEETDVRNRLQEAANNVGNVGVTVGRKEN